MYGRGYSEAPELPCDANLCTVQLALLLQCVPWDAVDTIIGSSTGGAVTAACVAMFPHLVRKNIVLVAAIGLMEMKNATPQEALVRGKQPTGEEWALKLRNPQTLYPPGFSRIFDSCGKEGLVDRLYWAYETIGKSDKRCLIVHGTHDGLVPYDEANKIMGYIPQAKFVEINGGTHFLSMEEGPQQMLVESILTFMRAER
ncbi:hypothetical protein PHLGIDRAFT_29619 [Phlebiopsis gigantea 11061_1 CR5-6]|uniref:AB hydrolase-1 domain-containing protein n=1 Tax=Phlebiopsis gigantea (strain 11061_1 CR5-6) TaxID=745531 RepID=A0A0C3S0F9_PHLG1|nr:hypothetical protein PHLGIDRAFT_29619 [Phlebiopsis gigantea 11061_1 CR5-6]